MIDREEVRLALERIIRRNLGSPAGAHVSHLDWVTLAGALHAYADQKPASDEEIDRIIAGVTYQNVHRDVLPRIVARAMEHHHGIQAPESAGGEGE